jgi:hypothetical protein
MPNLIELGKEIKMQPKIDTVPLPEHLREINFKIPEELIAEFKGDLRIVVRFPWLIGIPAPEFLLEKLGAAGKLKGFDVMIVPKEVNV